MNATNYVKDQRRPSSRLSTVMCRGTPCTVYVTSDILQVHSLLMIEIVHFSCFFNFYSFLIDNFIGNPTLYFRFIYKCHVSSFACILGMVRYIGAMIRKRLGLQHVSDVAVEHVFGVLKTNGVGQGAGRACYIYPVVSLMSHACRSNLEIVGTPGSQG